MTVQHNPTTTAPDAATFTAKEHFDDMLDAWAHFEGTGDTPRRLYDAAYHVLSLSEAMTTDAHSNAVHDLTRMLDASEIRTWKKEGSTYASAARLIRARLEKVLNGETA